MTNGPRDFFERAHQVFCGATRESRHEDFLLGNLRIRIESKMQFRLTSALQHLHASSLDDPDLTICAWDGAPMIPPAWSEADYRQRGEIRGFNNARFRTAFDHTSDALSMIDHERRLALFWTRDANRLPLHQLGAPFRNIISWFVEQHGMLLLHCAAIADERGAALLAGAGGSGKSTTGLVCARAGWSYLSDDYCVVDPADQPCVYALYNSAKVAHESAGRFGLDEMLLSPNANDGEKDLFFLPNGRLARFASCRAMFLPRVTPNETTTIAPASAAEALRAIAPSSMFQLSGVGTLAFQRLGELVRKLPIRRLNLGRDFDRIPQLIGECLTSL